MFGMFSLKRSRYLILVGSVTALSSLALFAFILTSDLFDTGENVREMRDLISLSASNEDCPTILDCQSGAFASVTQQFQCGNDTSCYPLICCLCFDGQKTRCSHGVNASRIYTTPNYTSYTGPTTPPTNFTSHALNGTTVSLNGTSPSGNSSVVTSAPGSNSTAPLNGTVTVAPGNNTTVNNTSG